MLWEESSTIVFVSEMQFDKNLGFSGQNQGMGVYSLSFLPPNTPTIKYGIIPFCIGMLKW